VFPTKGFTTAVDLPRQGQEADLSHVDGAGAADRASDRGVSRQSQTRDPQVATWLQGVLYGAEGHRDTDGAPGRLPPTARENHEAQSDDRADLGSFQASPASE
jgi:hypothetical protein